MNRLITGNSAMGEYKKRIRSAVFVLVGASLASFVTMLVVQAFMGGVRDIWPVLGKSVMIGLGMAFFIFLLPTARTGKYPWQ
jgi:hypothetical protein